jgi:outer membrane protein assembly factor BamB
MSASGFVPARLVAWIGMLFLVAPVWTLAPAAAQDWPQWRGPERSGLSRETGLLRSWPKEGPPLVWQIRDAGLGYSGPAIVPGRLVTLGSRGGQEYILCYDLQNGKEQWAVRVGPPFRRGEGPRSTPTVDGDRVYALGSSGELCCVQLTDGRELWRLNILTQFRGRMIDHGISESPLVEGKMVIVTPGGEDGTLVALDKLTGKTLWTSKDPRGTVPASYASPIAFTVGGVRQIATLTGKGAIGVRAEDGKFLWRNQRIADGFIIVTPVFARDHIFFTQGPETGSVLLRLTAAGEAQEVYFDRRGMRNHHGGVVLVDDYLYGYSDLILTCMKFDTAEVAWRDRSVGKGSLCCADGHLYILSEDGVVGLVEATPQGYREKGRFQLPANSGQKTWTHPVVAGGRLYLRDQQTISCYDVTAR